MLTFTVIFMSSNPFGWQALTMQGSSDSSIDVFPFANDVTLSAISWQTKLIQQSKTISLLTNFKCKKKSLTFNPLLSTSDLLALDLLAAIASLEWTSSVKQSSTYTLWNMKNGKMFKTVITSIQRWKMFNNVNLSV